jgi:hypothetical protein
MLRRNRLTFRSRRTATPPLNSSVRHHMKVLYAALALAIAGCATVDPAQIKIAVEPVTQICGASDREAPIRMTLHNDSKGKLRIWIDPTLHQPPYDISWLSYKILDGGGATDWEHGPGGHGPMPPDTLSIGPGDSAEIVGSLYGLVPADYPKSFMIQFKDLDDHTFVSSSFKACKAK